MRKLFVKVAALLSLLAAGASQATVIDFEALPNANGYNSHGFTVSEDGFTLNNLGSLAFASFGPTEGRYTGSVALFNDTIGGVTELVQDGGGAFDLYSIDIAELNGSAVADITFIGELLGGGFVQQTFTLDGLAFGMETFLFSGFVDVVRVSWSQDSPFHQFDNIVIDRVNEVPEPAPLLLLGLGLASFALLRRRSR